MTFQVAEPTLSPAVAGLLEKFLGCKIASEGFLPGKKQFDFFLILDGVKIIIELKIGGIEKLPSAIAQAEEYKEQVGANGIIAIVYPNEVKQTVTKAEDVELLASRHRPMVTVLCPFLKHYYPKTTLAELAQNLKKAIEKPTSAPSVDFVVQALRQSVQGISVEIKQSAGIDSPIITQTVGSLALFEILAQESVKGEKEENIKGVVADLASYILVNQILLYHILNRMLNLNRRIEPVAAPLELNAYFKVINDIDYKAVYCTDVASYISPSAVTEINIAILAIRALQPENLKHDLLGRIFHEFLPDETRKRLGTFYTRPQAADILAGLAIDDPYEKVIDPACGSGTLLVSAYRKKMFAGKGRPHKKLVEEEITGIDIMPFAAHLAALNLTMQSPLEPTDKTRIGIGNSLNLNLGDEVGSVAAWLREFGGDVIGVDVEQPLTKGEVFKVKPVDTVIMNPPFTRKESLTAGMKSIQWSFLGDQNYWAYFIPLADSLLKKNGKIAAVLPRDFFRGEYSSAVREYLFSKNAFGLKYVVKTTKDWAFSENALFRDFLIVVRKGIIPEKCAFIYIKKKLSEIGIRESSGIPITVKNLSEGEQYEDDTIFVTWRDQQEIALSWKDLGHLIAFNTQDGERLIKFYRTFLDTGKEKLRNLNKSSRPVLEILRGFEHGGENLQSLLFIVRPFSEKRLTRSVFVLRGDEIDFVNVVSKNGVSFKVPRRILRPGLRTSSYVSRLDLGKKTDYFITKPFDGFNEVIAKFGVTDIDFTAISTKARRRYTHLVLNRRFDLTAPGTKVLAFFSDDKVLPVGLHWALLTDKKYSKALCIWFNSVFYFLELLLLHTGVNP